MLMGRCKACESRNLRSHVCKLSFDIRTTSHPSRYRSGGRRRFYKRYHDVVRDHSGRFYICPKPHASHSDAERCARSTVRQLQRGKARVALTSITREYRPPPGGATPRAPIPGLKPEAWTAFKAIYDHRCYYCGAKGLKLQIEHRVPLARGGANDLDNIIPACAPCNLRKGTLTDEEFFTLIADRQRYVAEHNRPLGSPFAEDLRGLRQEAQRGEKRCAKCNRLLAYDAFGEDRRTPDRMAARCRGCLDKEAARLAARRRSR